MIGVVDYGVGNLFSLKSSLLYLGYEASVSSSPDELERADKLILPGVGAFGDAMDKLRSTGLDELIKSEASRGKPIMGVCLGMQLLFEKSEEFGNHKGLGLLEGSVVGMKGVIPSDLKIPHIGWNSLRLTGNRHYLLKYTNEGDYVYFVHSYFASGCDNSTVAVTDYGAVITAAVARDNVCGCQFHPEKSGRAGLSILKAFAETEA